MDGNSLKFCGDRQSDRHRSLERPYAEFYKHRRNPIDPHTKVLHTSP